MITSGMQNVVKFIYLVSKEGKKISVMQKYVF